MDRSRPSPGQIDRAAAEFKAEFGPSHTLEIIRDKGARFLIRGTVVGDASRTALSAIEPPVTKAAFAHARALAAEEHAQMYGEGSFCWTKNESAVPGACTLRSAHGSCNEALVKHLETTIIGASALTRHRHAAGYARFEHAKYAHLHRGRFPSVVRGAALQSRAYIGSAARRHGASVDVG